MDEKISLKAVDQYSINVANQLADAFFSRKEKISGSELLTLCEIKQVNLFVLNDLLSVWKQETEKLKSPYFDYDAKPVAEALIQFQNTLSNHILINKTNLLPLLKKGVSQTLYLILAPYDFFSDTLDKKDGEVIRTKDLKDTVKYIKTNRAPLEKLVSHLEERKLESIAGKEAFALLDHILEEVNFTPEDFEPYLSAFNKIAPISIDKFYEAKVVQAVPVQKQEPIIEVKVVETKTVTQSISVENNATASKPTLADNLAKQKMTRLKESLTINQKFMFTKILFHGDFEIFSEAIDKLDRFDNLTQATRFLDDGYPDWDKESEEYEEFIEIVQKRFS
jgi:hypothetical protein